MLVRTLRIPNILNAITLKYLSDCFKNTYAGEISIREYLICRVNRAHVVKQSGQLGWVGVERCVCVRACVRACVYELVIALMQDKNNVGYVRTFGSYLLTSQRTSWRTFWYDNILSDVMAYFVDLMNEQYSEGKSYLFWHRLNSFIYILTRVLRDLAFSEYLFDMEMFFPVYVNTFYILFHKKASSVCQLSIILISLRAMHVLKYLLQNSP